MKDIIQTLNFISNSETKVTKQLVFLMKIKLFSTIVADTPTSCRKQVEQPVLVRLCDRER